MRLSLNVVGDDETNFPHKFLLSNRQAENLRKAFASKSSTDINLPKTQLSKIVQSGRFLGRLLGPLLKTVLPLIKNVIKPFAKSVLIPLVLTEVASVADAGIHIKMLGSGRRHSSSLVLRHPSSAPKTTTLIISNYEMKDIIEIVKSLEDSSLFLKGVSETIQNEYNEQKRGSRIMLLGKLGASLFGNILAGKGINRAGEGAITKSISEETKSKRQGGGIVRAGYGNNKVRKKNKNKNKKNF